MEIINKDEQKQNELLEVYSKITEKLGTEKDRGNLSIKSIRAIINTIRSVSYKLTMNWDNVRKKVGDYMGGKIIELESVKKYDELVKRRDKEKIAEMLTRNQIK